MLNRGTRGLLACMLMLGFVLPRAGAAAGSRAAFDQALAELNKAPDDMALRKKVIELSRGLAVLPPVPDDVTVLKGKAAFAMKNANTPSDYLPAVKAYKDAIQLAPWVGDLYYNLGVVEEKAGLPEQAGADFKFYLLAEPDASDRAKVLERLGRLQMQADSKAQQAQQAVANQQKTEEVSKARAAWQGRETGFVLVEILGGLVLCGGAWEIGSGYGDTSGSYFSTTPGYANGVNYNIPYEGKYWSADSYASYTQGERELTLGWTLTGVSVGTMLLGLFLNPGPEPVNQAMLDNAGGTLAWTVPAIAPDANGGVSARLVHLAF